MAQDASPEHPTELAFTPEELAAYLDEVFPERYANWPPVHIERLAPYEAYLRMEIQESQLRPGGTISGPTMFMLADFSIYAAILAMIGRVPLAVTTNLSINFLRRPLQRDLLADVKLIKLGKRLAVGDVALRSDGLDELVAQATGTYSIPPPDKR